MGDTLETETREEDAENVQDVQGEEPSLADDPDMPRPGELIGDRYLVERVIGEGGFAAVYKCEDQRTGQAVAMKVLDPMMSRRGEFSKRFLREIRTVSQLRHHNTIKVSDSGETENGCLYLVMELLNGEDLDEILDREGAQTPARVKHIMSQVLKSLIEAHQAGIMHRDIKPGNVFIAEIPGETDYVKVLDFGIAKSRDDSADTSLTATGQVMCSPDYVAPERVRDHVCFFSSDLYSLGIMMLEMLEGELPYKGDTPIMVALQHARIDSEVPIKQYTLDGPLGPLVQKAVNKDASKRYQSAEEMLADLMRADCEGVPAYDATMPELQPSAAGKTTYLPGGETVTDLGFSDVDLSPEEKKRSRQPLYVFAGLISFMFLAGAITVFLSMRGKAEIEAQQAQEDEAFRLEREERAALAAAEREQAARDAGEDPDAFIMPALRMVNTSPQAAYVYVNDQRVGSTPYGLTTADLPDFPITLRLDGEEFEAQEIVFETPEEFAQARLSYTMVPKEVEKEPAAAPTRSSRSSSRSSRSSSSSSRSASKPEDWSASQPSRSNSERAASQKPASKPEPKPAAKPAEEPPSRRPRIAPISPRLD